MTVETLKREAIAVTPMSSDNLEEINAILELKQMHRFGSNLLKGREQRDFLNIREKYDVRRDQAEQLYRSEYKVRVDIAYRDLLEKAGAKQPDLKPRFYGLDRFNSRDLSRQAQMNVRLDHQQLLDRLDAREMKESRAFLQKCSRAKTYLEEFKQSAERRRSQTRRQSPERRRSQSPTMSD